MVIKRKFVPLCDLYRMDVASKNIIDKAYAFKKNKEERERLLSYNFENRTCVANAELGCGIPNFGFIKDEFETLDETAPFDNGFNISDIRDVKIIGKYENNITIELYCMLEGIKYPVAVIALEEDAYNKKIKLTDKSNCIYNVI